MTSIEHTAQSLSTTEGTFRLEPSRGTRLRGPSRQTRQQLLVHLAFVSWPFTIDGWSYMPDHTSYAELLGPTHQHRSC